LLDHHQPKSLKISDSKLEVKKKNYGPIHLKYSLDLLISALDDVHNELSIAFDHKEDGTRASLVIIKRF
jgi:hypothetical protein